MQTAGTVVVVVVSDHEHHHNDDSTVENPLKKQNYFLSTVRRLRP